MAAEIGDEARAVIERLRAGPENFDFFQAVRRLECTHPECPPTGQSLRHQEDPVRFGQHPSLRFAPATLHACEPSPSGRPRLLVNFLGLLGPNGPLPLHITEYVYERIMVHHDHALTRFLDVFNHRMLAFFYDAWARNHQGVSYERAEGQDRFAAYIASLIGRGMESFRNRDEIPDDAKLHYSGHLACQTRHAEGLRSILSDYFRAPVEIWEFMGQWLTLPYEHQCRLGETPKTGLVGATAIVGSKVWDCQQKFRIRFGPLSLKDFMRMLPNRDSLKRLCAWVKNYSGDSLSWEVQLILKKAEVPEIQMGKQGLMGWTTWLKSRPFEKDADDLVLKPVA